MVDCILELQFKGISGDIQHSCVLKLLSHVVANGIRQVGLAYSTATEEEQWVEDGLTRLLSNLHTRSTRQLIRLALDEVVKGVLEIELRLPRLVDDGTSGLLHHLASSRLLSTIAWDVNRATSHHDAVLQLHLCAKHLSQHAREDVQIIIFDIINHKLALHLQYQQVVVPLLCNNRSEPCLVRTLREIITQNLLAFRPQYVQIICH